jgi:putative autotransporter adhesin-like protein
MYAVRRGGERMRRKWVRGTVLGGAALLLLGTAGCGLDQPTITGSGSVVASPVAVGSFSRLEVGSAFHVDVTTGSTETVTLHVDENVLDLVDVHVSGEVLHIGLKPNSNVNDAALRADVTARELTGVDANGAAQVTLNGPLGSSSVDLSASGAGHLTGSLQTDHARLELSGASHATLSGSAGALDVEASGASDLEGEGLQVEDLTVELSGASSATLAVSGTISADLSGASSLHYTGSPSFRRREVSGGSSIESG